MKQIGWILAASLITTAALADQQRHDAATQAAGNHAIHQGAGKVVSVNVKALTVRLAHDAIKSLGWQSMTMDFRVANSALLDGIKAGDAVTFELDQGDKPGEWQIIRILPHGAGK
jgi:Cu/Ag efflux protein CusF